MLYFRLLSVAALGLIFLVPQFAQAAPPSATVTNVYQFQGLTTCNLISNSTPCDGFGPVGGLIIDGSTLYGTTSGGGEYDSGTLFAINAATNAYQSPLPHVFGGTLPTGEPDGASPQAPLTLVRGATPADDIIYGTTYVGGAAGLGTVFSYQPSTARYKVLHAFQGSYPSAGTPHDGALPLGPVTHSNGYLFGTTTIGGNRGCFDNDGCGTVFSIDLATGEEKILYAFQGSFPASKDGTKPLPDGNDPLGGLTVVQGVLYGTTSSGGGYGCFAAEGCGTVFQIALQPGHPYTVLHRFCSSIGPNPTSPGPGQFCLNDGATPAGGLTPQKSSDTASVSLYGATAQGGLGNCGIGGCGTVFSITPATAIGGAAMVQTVFGITAGAFFNPSQALPSGVGPEGNLIATKPDYSHRGLVGATLSGGAGADATTNATSGGTSCNTPDIPGPAGTVYQLLLDPPKGTGPKLKTLFNFDSSSDVFDGAQPEGAFVPYTPPGGKTRLFGTTFAGGTCQSGTVFMIDNIGSATAALSGR